MHEFHVLQDFSAFVKGLGYVFAAVFLIGLVPFWLYLTGGEDKTKKFPKKR
ncbi:MAG: hmc operon protein 4 [Deltaproteobacteria bacterium]|nr:hmc operon protein 4 [Deltaproteobacteria bacterium]